MEPILKIPSVTGVDVELRIAGPGARSYAFVIDWNIRFLAAVAWLFSGYWLVVGSFRPLQLGDPAYAQFAYAVLAPSLAIYFLYHPVLETLLRGQTPGKRFGGVRLVAAADGGAPSIGALLIRNVFRLIDSLPLFYGVGLITTMITRYAVRSGDIAAGTVLVYEERGSGSLLDGLTSVGAQRLGLEHAQLVRDVLARWHELGGERRAQLARELLAKLGGDGAQAANGARASDGDLERRLKELLA